MMNAYSEMNVAQLYPRSGKKGVLGGELQKLETVRLEHPAPKPRNLQLETET